MANDGMGKVRPLEQEHLIKRNIQRVWRGFTIGQWLSTKAQDGHIFAGVGCDAP